MLSVSIERLLRQRAPILVVDGLVDAEGDVCHAVFTIPADNLFVENGEMAEVGLIEHMAQAASAFTGLRALQAGATEPPLGMIGEVKNFRLHRLPRAGEQLQTTITFGPSAAGVTLVSGSTSVGSEPIAETLLKVSF